MLVLLMTAVTGAWADADVTWNSSNVSDIQFWGGAPDGWDSYTKEGITLRGNAEQCDANWANYGYGDGINFNMNASGGYTFTAPDGKKFTKIEMTIYSYDGWYTAAYNDKLGSGWPSGEDAAMTVYSTNKVTWTGDATSTVDLLTDAGLSSFGGTTVSSIDFYFEASAEPATYSIALAAGTEDAENWEFDPAEGTADALKAGTKVALNYSGEKTVKSVRAWGLEPATYMIVASASGNEKVFNTGLPYENTLGAIYEVIMGSAPMAMLTVTNVTATGENVTVGAIDGWDTTISITGEGDATINVTMNMGSIAADITVVKNEPVGIELELSPDETGTIWTLAEMPAADMEVEVEYEEEEVPTGIGSLKAGSENGETFNLNGQRLSSKPAQKGIYIIDGKKVVIK